MTAVAGFTPAENNVVGFTPAQNNVSGFTPSGGDSTYDLPKLKALWTQAGGRPEDAEIMAHTALAESSGNPHARGPDYAEGGKTYHGQGLWQVSTVHGPGNYEDPLTNAQKAVELHRGSGMTPWEDSRNKGGGGGWGQFYKPSPTGEAQLQNRDFPATRKVAGFTPTANAAHPTGVGATKPPPAGNVAGFTPLSLSGQITDRAHTTTDPFTHPHPGGAPAVAPNPAIPVALDAAGSNLTALTPAGGIIGGLLRGTGEEFMRGPFAKGPPTTDRFFDALGKTLTGHAGEANRAYGLAETPTATQLGYGGPQGVIQKADRGLQAGVRAILPPPSKVLPDNPIIAKLRTYANDPNAPEMDESTVRGLAEFVGTLGKVPGNQIPAAVAKVVGDTAKGVPGFLQQENAALRQFAPKAADVAANVGHKIAGVGDAAQSSFNRYHAAMQDVAPADQPAARVALRAADTARVRGGAMADKLTDTWAKGLAPGAEDRVIDAYQAMYKGQRVVNNASNEERVAGQALRDAAAADPSLATRPIRSALGDPSYVTKANPAGATALTLDVLKDHPGVDPAKAMDVAQAMEHADRMPPNLTADEVSRAKKLAQAEAIAWSVKAKHPELVKGIDRDKEQGYFPMSNAMTSDDMVGGGRAPGGSAAVDYGHLKPATYQTVAEARLHAPTDSPEKTLFGKASPREIFRRAMATQMESAYALDARDALAKLHSKTPGKMLIESPSYVSPITGMAAPKQQAIKDLEKWKTLDATPKAAEDVLGPGMTAEDLPNRRPRLASKGELQAIQRAAGSANAVDAQGARDLERVGRANEVGQTGVEDAAAKVGGIMAPTERVSAAMEPQIDSRLTAMHAESTRRMTAAGNAYAKAVEDFGAESPQAKPLWDAYSKAAEADAKVQSRVDAAKAQLGETLNRGLGAVDRSVAGQAATAAKGVAKAAQRGAVRVDKATQATLNRLTRGTARFTDRYHQAVVARDLSLQDRDVLDRFDKALQKHIADQNVTPKTLFEPESVKGYQPLSKLRQGLQGENEDLHAVDSIHKYLAADHAPPDVSSWLAKGLDAARRTARSSLVFNYIIHTGWNEGGITMAHMGPKGAEAVMDAMTNAPTPNKYFDDWFNTKKFSDAPNDTMKYWDMRGQKVGHWHPSEYGSYAVGDAREVARDAQGRITGYRDTPNRGADYATMRTAPLKDLPLKDKATKIGYELQKANSDTVFNRGERIYSAYLFRHFVQDEGLSDAEAANKVRESFSDDRITDWEKNSTRSWMFFYHWMRTANALAMKLGVQKPQTFNAPLQGTRVQREGVGAEGVQMSKSNPYTIARRSPEGGYDYWGAPLWNRSLEPVANLVTPTGPTAEDRYAPAASYLAGHLAPVPGLAVNAYEEATMGDKVAPWQQLWDPYGSGADAGQISHGVAGQFLYPLREAEEVGAAPEKLGGAVIGGTTGHREATTVDQVNAKESSYDVYELKKKQKAAWARGDNATAAELQRDIDSQEGR